MTGIRRLENGKNAMSKKSTSNSLAVRRPKGKRGNGAQKLKQKKK
jgi:hypothetical protein